MDFWEILLLLGVIFTGFTGAVNWPLYLGISLF